MEQLCPLDTWSVSSSRRLTQASSHGSLRVPSSKRGQAQCTGTFHTPACIRLATEPFVKVSHMTKPRFKGCGNKLHRLMGGAAKYCSPPCPVYPDRCEFLVTLGRKSYLILGVSGVIQLSQEELKITMEQFKL